MYDLIILGGGPGGYVAAERAARAGLKTALFEKRSLGGVCLNEGCIPSKTFLNSGKLYHHATDSAAYGITAEHCTIDQAKVVKRKNKVVRKLVAGVKLKMKNAGVDVFMAEAKITGKKGEAFAVVSTEGEYETKNIIVATGSEVAVPPIPGVKEALGDTVLTSREILDLSEIPENLTVIGGGVIGLEMACYFQTIGAKVTVIEMLDHIGGHIDLKISKVLQDIYAKRGMQFHLNSKVLSVEGHTVYFEQDGEKQAIESDKILLSTGRRAVTENTGIENVGVELERRVIKVDNHMRTNVAGIYAIGDVIGGVMLAHVASREGEVAVNTILGVEDQINYNAIPAVIYTDPEVADVGMQEQEFVAQGVTYKTVELPLTYSGRYVAETEMGTGICRVFFSEDNKLLGVHLIGPYVSEMIVAFTAMIENGMTLAEMRKVVFPHPTVCEIVHEALHELN